MALESHSEELNGFCQRWGIAELAVFGSAVRDDFGPDSDVDLLVEFLPATRPTLMDLVRMKAELERIVGRPVDLLSRNGVTASRNYIRRDAILQSAKVLYAA